MMRAVLLAVFAILFAGPAMADDLSGRYQGPGAPEQATIIDITQTGTALTGEFRGAGGGRGTLEGEVRGTAAAGLIVVPAVGQARFEMQSVPEGLRLRIFDPGKTTEVVLRRIGPAEDTRPEPAAAPATLSYYVAEDGTAAGPFTLEQVLARLRAAGATGDRQVWRSDTQVWVRADSLPELAAAMQQPQAPAQAQPVEPTYYIAENGAAVGPFTPEQALSWLRDAKATGDRQVWRSDTQAWVRADSVPELQAALQPPVPAAPQPAAPTYYVAEPDAAAVGPFTLEQMLARLRDSHASGERQVWRSDTQVWMRADSVPELQAALQPPAPAQPQPAAPSYYVAENGAAVGPFTLEQVLARLQGAKATGDQQVWRSDTQAWVPAGSVPELRAALQPTAPTPPQPAALSYYVAENGAAIGPFTLEQAITRLHAAGAAGDRQVWRSDAKAWVRADSLPELQPGLQQASPPQAAPADDGATDAAFRDAVRGIAAADDPQGTPERLNAASACLLQAFEPLSAADRAQFLLDIRTGSAAGGNGLDQAFPGLAGTLDRLAPRFPALGAAVEACI
jgi:hypothetical protein